MHWLLHLASPFFVPLRCSHIRNRCLGLLVLATLGLGGCASNQAIDASHPGYGSGMSSQTTEGERSEVADQLWLVFERYEGVPYRYGGTTASGFDCSGFIVTAYREGLDHQLPRTTSQMLAAGDFVGRDQIRPGDLVFFRVAGKEQHAGIYMGGDRFIHSSTSIGVTESSLNGYYWRGRFTQARRFR